MPDVLELLRLENVRLHDHAGRQVLEDCCWEMLTGQRLRLSHGGGGSAFLRLCAGILQPEAGSVFLGGKVLGPHSFGHPFFQGGLFGWLPSDGGLLVNLDLRSNLAMPLRFLRGVKRARAEVLAQAMLEGVDLGAHAEKRPHAIEPRLRWLVGLLRAASLEPALWLVDQPPALEESERQSALEIFRKSLSDEKVAMIIACHGEPFGSLTQAVASLQKGRMVTGGPVTGGPLMGGMGA